MGCCSGGALLAGVDDGLVGGWGLGQACCREDEEGQGEGGEMHDFSIEVVVRRKRGGGFL